jgi:hypothetical protein
MRCWNCNKKIPDDAKLCKHCEAPVSEAPTEEEMKAVHEILAGMDEETQQALIEAVQRSSSVDDFVNSIMVGDCPSCGSSDVDDCGDDPEIDDITVGRCLQCGQMWCTECELVFKKGQTHCDRCPDD